MNRNEYEELNRKVKIFEELSEEKEKLENKIERLKKYRTEDTDTYIDIKIFPKAKVYFTGDISERMCDIITQFLEIELQNISTEIEKL